MNSRQPCRVERRQWLPEFSTREDPAFEQPLQPFMVQSASAPEARLFRRKRRPQGCDPIGHISLPREIVDGRVRRRDQMRIGRSLEHVGQENFDVVCGRNSADEERAKICVGPIEGGDPDSETSGESTCVRDGLGHDFARRSQNPQINLAFVINSEVVQFR